MSKTLILYYKLSPLYYAACIYVYAFLTVVAIPTKPHPNAQSSSHTVHPKLQLLKEVCGVHSLQLLPWLYLVCMSLYCLAVNNRTTGDTVGPVLIAIIANCDFFQSSQTFDSQCILLIAHHYVQFAQTQLLNVAKCNN